MIAEKKILIIGSSNTDMVIKTERFPTPGETIIGGNFFLFPGGKGANQAVAAARLGGNVTFIAKVGKDIFGQQALQQFRKEKIDTRLIIEDPSQPSGTALITVDAKGENTIVVAPGANGSLFPEDLEAAGMIFTTADVLLMQLEIPLKTVVAACQKAKAANKKVILNPAPATTLPDSIFGDLYLITPNRAEAEFLSGVKITDMISAEDASRRLLKKGVRNVVITLGPEGVYIHDGNSGNHIPAPKVHAVDTTAAGDIFNGALAVALCEGLSLTSAAEFANRCAAISVTRMGAQASAPFRSEVSDQMIIQQ